VAEPYARELVRPLGGVRTYALMVRTWSRAAAQYRTTLLMLSVNAVVNSCLDLAAVLLIFANTKSLAGFTLAEVLYLSGAARTAFILSDCFFSGTENISSRIRLGTFDGLLIRPVGVLPQVFADRFTPQRFGRIVSAGGTLAVGIALLHVQWTPLRIAMVPYTVIGGVAVYGAVWVLVGAFQIVATDASEAMAAVTYGGSFLTSYPMSLYGRDFGLFLTFGLPLAFVNWQPSLYVLDHPDPLGLPTAFRFAAPVAAAALWTVALLAWNSALRHHRSTGS
jgi:ABC-2 type transport system permease protein